MSSSFNAKKGQTSTAGIMKASFNRKSGQVNPTGIHQSRASAKRLADAKNPMSNPQVNRNPGQPADTGPLHLLNNPAKFRNISFPQNIGAVDHYISISAYEKRHFPAFGGARDNTSVKQRCILPMPSNLVTGYKQEYKSEAIGVAGAFVGSALNQQKTGDLMNAFQGGQGFFKEGGKAFGAATSFVAGTIGTLKEDINKGVVLAGALRLAQEGVGTAAGAATMGLGGAFVAAGASKGFEAFQAARGRAANPHTSVIYDAPSLRAFSFQWDLRPKNYYESIQIARAVAFFKFYSAPSFEKGMSNHFFKYPNQFRLKIKHDEFLFSFGDCVLTNFEVDYHGEGTPIYYDAAGSVRAGNKRLKAPAAVKISTEWQETSIVTKDTIADSGR